MKSILAILFTFLSCGLFAQTKPAAGSNCFKEWYTLFKERGANAIPDGPQDVIITLRTSDYNDCFMGRIDILSGKINGKLQIQKMDGSYQEFDKSVSGAYQNPEGALKEELREITNGMSAPVTLSGGEMIRLFFYKSLAEKPKANKTAPAPSALVKN